MAEKQENKPDQSRQSNKGANDGRLAPMNEEQREIATKGGKATPALERDAGLEKPSDAPDDGDQSNNSHKDQSHQNSDDETGARGGIMGGSSTRG